MPLLFADIVPEPARAARHADRHPVSALAQCRRGSLREAVHVLDLSPGGARIRTLAPLRAGHPVWLRLPGLEPIEVRVVWTRGCESGCELVQPLHPAVYDSLLKRM